MSDVLGIGVGVSSTSTSTARVGTQSAFDFAYWASTFVVPDPYGQYTESGPETTGVPLVVWSAGQVGVTVPDTFTGLTGAFTAILTVDKALRTRGAVLVNDTQVAVCLGLYDIVDIQNGKYIIRRLKSDTDKAKWLYGARVPGVTY